MPDHVQTNVSGVPPVELYAQTNAQADKLVTKLVETWPLFERFGQGDPALAYGALVTKLDSSMNKEEMAIALAAAIRKLHGTQDRG